MRVMVATRESQGSREWDLWRSCIEGELIRPIEERCAEHGSGPCSCETAFVGLVSHGLTTTAVVRELPALTMPDYADALEASLSRRERGFIVVDRYAEELSRAAGAVHGDGPLERWDEWIGLRFVGGELSVDIVALADVDPAELEDLC